MAMCENCSKKGFKPQDMIIQGEQFLGPCCASRPVLPEVAVTPSELDAGVAITTRHGIQAYARYEGFEVRFHRTPEEIEKWFQGVQESNKFPTSLTKN